MSFAAATRWWRPATSAASSSLEVGDRIEFGGRPAIVRAIEPLLRAPNEKQGPLLSRRMPLCHVLLKGWCADGEAVGQRRAVAACRAADPEGRAPLPLPGTQADRRSEGVDGDPVRVADGDPVGVPAQGDGLRVGDDLLASPQGMAGAGRVAAAARAAAGEAARVRPDRLVTGGDRQLARPRRWGARRPVQAQ